MAQNSAIQWTDTTWNPLAGCTWASSGCDRCYAAIMACRLEAMARADIEAGKDPGRKAKYIGITNKNSAGRIMFNGKVNLDYAALLEPFSWRRPRRVFVNSMSDLFHKDVPYDFIARVFAVMAMTPQHTYQVLTKRPDRMAEIITQLYDRDAMDITLSIIGNWWDDIPSKRITTEHVNAPLSNVWAGCSVEDQRRADERIPHLLRVPARVRFLSCEPLLGPIELWHFDEEEQALRGVGIIRSGGMTPSTPDSLPEGYDDSYPGIDWVICGGESGHGARPMHPDWARSLRDQCQAAGVPYFFKQWGEYAPGYTAEIRSARPRIHMASDGATWPATTLQFAQDAIGQGANMLMYHVGKPHAGRLLDGVEHNAYPA